MFKFVERVIENIKFIFDVGKLPISCPVCGNRKEIIVYLERSDEGDDQLLCRDCEVVFAKNEPQKYKDASSVKYERLKNKILQP